MMYVSTRPVAHGHTRTLDNTHSKVSCSKAALSGSRGSRSLHSSTKPRASVATGDCPRSNITTNHYIAFANLEPVYIPFCYSKELIPDTLPQVDVDRAMGIIWAIVVICTWCICVA